MERLCELLCCVYLCFIFVDEVKVRLEEIECIRTNNRFYLHCATHHNIAISKATIAESFFPLSDIDVLVLELSMRTQHCNLPFLSHRFLH